MLTEKQIPLALFEVKAVALDFRFLMYFWCMQDDMANVLVFLDHSCRFDAHVILAASVKVMLYVSAFFLLASVTLLCESQRQPVILQDVLGFDPNNIMPMDVTLIGANGDLAKKYLWKGLFDFFKSYIFENNNIILNISFTGAGRQNTLSGTEQLLETLDHVLQCVNETLCLQAKVLFIKQVKYVQLKTSEDYRLYCSNTMLKHTEFNDHCYSSKSCGITRIFYLSVPPFTYKSIVGSLSKFCRPPENQGTIKVVLEKPFGHDQQSADEMVAEISALLQDEEVFRVDHYLGKQAVQQIVPFRLNNPMIDNMLNADFVERIDIVMKEQIGVKGRTGFYDEYGVICDVIQNHLSEILYLLAINLEGADTEVHGILNEKRYALLQHIYPLSAEDVLLGQYKGYQEEAASESGVNNSSTPTFAGALLRIDSNRWRNVPIVLMAGKKMDERVGYARILFKDRKISPRIKKSECPTSQQVVFHIGHGTLKTPAILVSRGLNMNRRYMPKGWTLTTRFNTDSYMGVPGSCFYVFTPEKKRDAYSFLIEHLLLGHGEHFVSTKVLKESWEVWGPVAKRNELVQPRIYPGDNDTMEVLDFVYSRHGLSFSAMMPETKKAKQTSWLGGNVTSGPLGDTVAALAGLVEKAIGDAVRDRNVFHIALSGGSTPLPLFQYLASTRAGSISWEKVHIWQVDERCSRDPSKSNFNGLCRALIDKMPDLKYEHIHPMSLGLYGNELCPNASSEAYEHEMSAYLGSSKTFDLVLLGVGLDGHVASLFPFSDVLREDSRYVALVEDGPPEKVPRRLSLTFPALFSARKVSVLVTGASKCKIISELTRHQCSSLSVDTDMFEKQPVCRLVRSHSNVSWFIDSDAFCV